MCSTVAQIPEARSTATDTRARFEKRGTTTESTPMRRAAGWAAQSRSSPARPPTHSAPDVTCSQSSATASPRGAVCAAWPAAAGITSADAAAATTPIPARISAIERCSRSGRSTHSAIQAARTKSAKQISRST